MPSPRPSGRGHGLEQTGHCGVPAECHQGCLCCVGPVWCPRPRVVSPSLCGVPVPVCSSALHGPGDTALAVPRCPGLVLAVLTAFVTAGAQY